MRYPNTVLIALIVLTTSCSSGPEKETLVIYSPHGKEMLNRFEVIFEEAHPEVDVQWIDMGGQNAYDRIRTEKERPQASIWWGGSSMAFNRAAYEGLLEPYTPSWANTVTDDMHHPFHMWYGTFLTPEVIAFNSRTLPKDEDIPKDWDDLLDPQWRDRVLIRYPLALCYHAYHLRLDDHAPTYCGGGLCMAGTARHQYQNVHGRSYAIVS